MSINILNTSDILEQLKTVYVSLQKSDNLTETLDHLLFDTAFRNVSTIH